MPLFFVCKKLNLIIKQGQKATDPLQRIKYFSKVDGRVAHNILISSVIWLFLTSKYNQITTDTNKNTFSKEGTMRKNYRLFIMFFVLFSTYVSANTIWTTGAYANNEDRRVVLAVPNAKKLIVTVDGVTERHYDFIYIYNSRRRMVKKLHGVIHQEFTVRGSSIVARLKSDSSVTESGVTVTVRDADHDNTDTVKPTITLLGENPVMITVGETYTDAGAVANDDVDGNITDKITVTNTVDTSTPGTYTVTYDVSDAAGNEADVVTRTVIVAEASAPSKVLAFYADEHNTDPTTPTGNRVLQIDIENMSLVNALDVPGIAGHHADNAYNNKIYAVPKGSNFVNIIKLSRDANGTASMQRTGQIDLIHKPRSGDAYNKKYHLVFLTASNRPMGSFIDVETDRVVGTIGEEVDCNLTDGTRLLSHSDANTASGALKYQCATKDARAHGGTQISGHPYWLTEDIAAIVDRANNQISTYRIKLEGTQIRATLMNRMPTRTSVHQIAPRDRTNLPPEQQADFYAVEEGVHADPDDLTGGVAHALLHMKLTTNGLVLVRRMNLQRTEVLPKEKAQRILNSCISIYRSTFNEALTGPSQTREDRYNALFATEGITRNPDQDPYNDFPVDCFYPGIPGGHNADFAPNNKHLYIGMAGGAMSIVDVNRWKIANNIDIGLRTAPGHTCFSEKNNVALTSNHGFSSVFGGAMTRSIRYINSERPIGYYWIKLPFDREQITNTAVSHSCYVDESGDNYYNFFTDGGVFYKIDLTGVFSNPTNGSSDLVVDSFYTGGVPIQGSYLKLQKPADMAAMQVMSARNANTNSLLLDDNNTTELITDDGSNVTNNQHTEKP